MSRRNQIKTNYLNGKLFKISQFSRLALVLVLSACTGEYHSYRVGTGNIVKKESCHLETPRARAKDREPALVTQKIQIHEKMAEPEPTHEVQAQVVHHEAPKPHEPPKSAPQSEWKSHEGRWLASAETDSGQEFQFKVFDEGLTLSIISKIIYGNTKKWQEIAEWNQISAPYRIRLGQVLILKGVAPVPEAELKKRLLDLWRAKLSKRAPQIPNYSQKSPPAVVKTVPKLKPSPKPTPMVTPQPAPVIRKPSSAPVTEPKKGEVKKASKRVQKGKVEITAPSVLENH